jgi:hypothetical protein
MALSRTYFNTLVDETSPGSGTIIDKTMIDAIYDDIDAALAIVGGAQVAAVSLATNQTTTSSSLVDVTSATLTMTTTGGNVLLLVSLPMKTSSSAGFLTFSVDGADQAIKVVAQTTFDQTVTAFLFISAPSAASHTWKVRVRNGDGAATITLNCASVCNGNFLALELK